MDEDFLTHIITDIIYFFGIDPFNIIEKMTMKQYEEMMKRVKKLEREHHIIASKTRPEFAQIEDNVVDTSDSQGNILEKVKSFQEKIKPIQNLQK